MIDKDTIYDVITLLRERGRTGKSGEIDDRTLLMGAANFMEEMARKIWDKP